ncbi:MAG: helix-turn-helix transcriptional regulator [Prevotellaceae bacterium]|nr:helix-turn-helix transcriptional regulator [Prevotella sp.]MDD7258215.1 helix-turn-helix transcriptional regulator [Prevotellaceae bacterium]MDY6130602.1 helix-turn-helix transcriptional regulator [Prevotella sp.]
MNKLPQQLTSCMMREAMDATGSAWRSGIFINHEMAVINEDTGLFRSLLLKDTPFSINDFRIGYVKRGELRAVVNLIECRLTAGTIAFVGPGSVVQPISASADFQMLGFALFDDFPMPFASGKAPSLFNGQMRDWRMVVDKKTSRIIEGMLTTIWNVVNQKEYDRETVGSLVEAMMHFYTYLYNNRSDRKLKGKQNGKDVFDRFIQLVNKNCRQHHRIPFYADKLCLSERYLGTLIKETSGMTAKEWIDRALITTAKVMLKHGNLHIVQVAEELHFANPSFFCKYFKRITGMTPYEYRES